MEGYSITVAQWNQPAIFEGIWAYLVRLKRLLEEKNL